MEEVAIYNVFLITLLSEAAPLSRSLYPRPFISPQHVGIHQVQAGNRASKSTLSTIILLLPAQRAPHPIAGTQSSRPEQPTCKDSSGLYSLRLHIIPTILERYHTRCLLAYCHPTPASPGHQCQPHKERHTWGASAGDILLLLPMANSNISFKIYSSLPYQNEEIEEHPSSPQQMPPISRSLYLMPYETGKYPNRNGLRYVCVMPLLFHSC